ncbi:hypothetical protein RclHR1_06410011 [Rhizophagus clarus]|uniref:Uncharacterized protein n=1 Tax=Rhizophagus clarus TaxID=94130 RepID=A0A2Z6RSR8_9GLOM|nr:hypothetical protein RclHR1_06410011 [Rhizophagus clarus]
MAILAMYPIPTNHPTSSIQLPDPTKASPHSNGPAAYRSFVRSSSKLNNPFLAVLILSSSRHFRQNRPSALPEERPFLDILAFGSNSLSKIENYTITLRNSLSCRHSSKCQELIPQTKQLMVNAVAHRK